MQKQFLLIWLIVSFGAFAGTAIAQRAPNDFFLDEAGGAVWVADTVGLYEQQTCTGVLWPASSDEVVQWLLGPMPCEEDLAAVELCARQRLRGGPYAGLEYRWHRALAHAMMGVLAFRRERFAEASEYFDVFRRLAAEQFGALSQAVADAEICLGRVSLVQGDDARALFYYQSATANIAAAALRTHPHLIQVWDDMLEICERRADFTCVCLNAEVLAQYEQGRSEPDTLRWVQILTRASMAHLQMASIQEAHALLKRAEALMLAHGEAYRRYRTTALVIDARLKAGEERCSEAMSSIFQAQALCVENGKGTSVPLGEVWVTAAEIALQQHAFNLAEQYVNQYEQGLEHRTGDGLRRAARTAAVRGHIWRERRQLNEAIDLLERQVAVLQRADFSVPEVATLQIQLAQLYADKGQLDKAQTLTVAAVRRHQAVFSQGHPNTLRACLALGELCARRGLLSEALQYVDLVIPILQSPAGQMYSARLLLLEALQAKARYLLSVYRASDSESALAKAESAVQEGYRVALQLGQSARAVEQILALHPRVERLTETGIAIAFQQYACDSDSRHIEEAFEAAQRSQDFVWAPAFAQPGIHPSEPAILHLAANSRRLYTACLEQTVRYWHVLGETAPARPEAALRQAETLKHANAAYYGFLDTLNWRYRSLLTAYTPVAANLIASKLQKREAFLHYFVGREAIYVFVITRKPPHDVIEIPLDFPLSEWVDAMRSAIVYRTERMRAFYEPAHDLYRRVFKPVEQRLSGRVESVAIVPHGVLSGVPFGALLVTLPRPKKAHRPCDYDYLIKHYAIYYAYSANHWLSSRKSAAPWPERRAYVMAPRDERLKMGREEAQNVGRLLGCTSLNDTLSKEQLLDTLRKALLIHIVGHSRAANDAVLYWKGPLKDSLAHLYALDVLALSLKARLVGLSACETALPSYYHPYGLSMSRAFAYAGAACVTGAEWAIEDNASQKIMEDFYGLLRKQRTDSKAHALQEAQRDFLEQCNSRMSHPYYWAGFRLYGDARPFERPERRAIRQMARAVRKGLRHLSP